MNDYSMDNDNGFNAGMLGNAKDNLATRQGKTRTLYTRQTSPGEDNLDNHNSGKTDKAGNVLQTHEGRQDYQNKTGAYLNT